MNHPVYLLFASLLVIHCILQVFASGASLLLTLMAMLSVNTFSWIASVSFTHSARRIHLDTSACSSFLRLDPASSDCSAGIRMPSADYRRGNNETGLTFFPRCTLKVPKNWVDSDLGCSTFCKNNLLGRSKPDKVGWAVY